MVVAQIVLESLGGDRALENPSYLGKCIVGLETLPVILQILTYALQNGRAMLTQRGLYRCVIFVSFKEKWSSETG